MCHALDGFYFERLCRKATERKALEKLQKTWRTIA